MPKARPPGVPLWKRLIVGVSMGGAVLLTYRALVHWHLAIASTLGLLIAFIVVIWLIAGPPLGLPKGWWWRGWRLP
jgi:hypothetical protein